MLNSEYKKDEYPYEIRVELEELIKKKLKDYDDWIIMILIILIIILEIFNH